MARLDLSLLERERKFMPTNPKGKKPELSRETEDRNAEVISMMAEIHGPMVGE